MIAFVVDERLSRERRHLLNRIINALRQDFHIELIGGDLSEEDLLARLEAKPYSLVLAPWYRYLAWTRVEAFYGLARTSGPTFAGYFSDQVLPYELGSQADHLRTILLDFAHLSPHEVHVLVRALAQEQNRSGIRPLLETKTKIYCESWMGNQGLGTRMDTVLSLPEIAEGGWSRRSGAIRICLSALWSLVYEEGPGKGDFAQALASKTGPKAYFQVAIDKKCLALRLCYSMNGLTPKAALSMFWPDSASPTHPAHLLHRYADILRIHTIADTSDVEIVACLFASDAAEKAPTGLHTLWIEPIAPHIVTELPGQPSGIMALPEDPLLKPLPGVPEVSNTQESKIKNKDKTLFDAATKIKELLDAVVVRDELIRELKSGGVGAAHPLSPPDAEALIEGFQERFFEARFQLRQLELQIYHAEKQGATPLEIQQIQQRISALMNREHAWIKKISEIVEIVKGSGS